MGAICGGRPGLSIVEKYNKLTIEYARVAQVANDHLKTIQDQARTIKQLKSQIK